MTLILRSDKTITALPPGTPVLPPAEVIATSDTFTRANASEVVGSMTDAALGGQPAAWVGDGGYASINAGQLVLAAVGATSSGPALSVTSPDHFIRAKVAKATGADFFITARRTQMGFVSRLTLQVTTTALTLSDRVVGQNNVTTGTHAHPLKDGDVIGLYVKDKTAQVLLNDNFVITAPTVHTDTGVVGISQASWTAVTIDDITAGNLP